MDNEKLLEIRNNLAVLPILEERFDKLQLKAKEAEEALQGLKLQYEREALDVEQIEKESLKNTLLRLVRVYDDKREKEIQEMLTAKLKYDQSAERLKNLQHELEESRTRIALLKKDESAYKEELKNREQRIKNKITDANYAKYQHLDTKAERLLGQLAETAEAVRAAQAVRATAESAQSHLSSAESWATYDVWAKGGIISHMVKYDHIDNAQADFNRLTSQIRDLNKELQDVGMLNGVDDIGIEKGVRLFDFWFDNIFTDLNVREKIRRDIDAINQLRSEVGRLITRLENKIKEIKKDLTSIEQEKNDLLINIEEI